MKDFNLFLENWTQDLTPGFFCTYTEAEDLVSSFVSKKTNQKIPRYKIKEIDPKVQKFLYNFAVSYLDNHFNLDH